MEDKKIKKKSINSPSEPGRRSGRGAVLQQDQRDCGVACLLSLVRHYGGDSNFEHIRRLCGADLSGTTLLGLKEAANALGFEAEGYESDIQSLIEHGKPTILHVELEGGLQHYVVWYSPPAPRGGAKCNSPSGGWGGFIIGDPASGMTEWTTEELQKYWKSGTCLVLEPTERFEKVAYISSKKRSWFLDLLREDYQILVISAAVGVLVAALGLAMSIYSQQLIDKIIPSKKADKLIVATILVVVLLLARIGLTALRQVLLLRQSKDFGIRLNNAFFEKLLNLPKSFFDTRKTGDFVARLNDTRRIQATVSTLAGNLLIDFLLTLAAFGLLFYYDWVIGLISLLILPAYFFLIYRQNTRITKAQTNVMTAYSFSESNYINTIQGIADVKNKNRESFFGNINRTLYSHFQSTIYDLGIVQTRLSAVAGIASIVFIAVVLAITLFKVQASTLKIGEMTAILGAVSMLLSSVSSLALISVPINEAKVAFERMYEYVKNPSAESEINDVVESVVNFQSLELKNVSFRFSGKTRQLKNINLSVSRGEIISIVGESGGGKSLICQLIQKFYEPESGQVVVNQNIDLQSVKIENWRSLLSVVPQQVHLFNGTVLENICLSNSEQEMQQALTLLNSHGFAPFIDGLPQGILTIVGEEGVSLSGGQRQLVGIARALCNKPQLLILDEATASLDRPTERFVLDLIEKLKSEMAIIFITHRIHTLRQICNRIYVLENGTFSHQGSHHELMQTQNKYSDYWNEILSLEHVSS